MKRSMSVVLTVICIVGAGVLFGGCASVQAKNHSAPNTAGPTYGLPSAFQVGLYQFCTILLTDIQETKFRVNDYDVKVRRRPVDQFEVIAGRAKYIIAEKATTNLDGEEVDAGTYAFLATLLDTGPTMSSLDAWLKAVNTPEKSKRPTPAPTPTPTH